MCSLNFQEFNSFSFDFNFQAMYSTFYIIFLTYAWLDIVLQIEEKNIRHVQKRTKKYQDDDIEDEFEVVITL